MPDDRFKKYQEAGVDFLETARARAEEFLRELSKAGESTQRQGRDTLDDLLEGSRKGTEQMRKGTEQMLDSVRKEVRAQLSLLGLATKEDLAALERRLRSGAPAAKAAPARKAAASKTTAKKAGAAKSGASKSTAAKKSTAAGKSSGSKTTAKRSTAAKKATGRA